MSRIFNIKRPRLLIVISARVLDLVVVAAAAAVAVEVVIVVI